MLNDSKWTQIFYQLALLSGAEKVQAVSNELKKFTDPLVLNEMLDEFKFEASVAVHPNVESYFHDNGFDKIVLFDDKVTKMKMRLHIWHPSKTHRVRQNVHNHRWDFSSLILLGRITQLTYDYTGDSEPENFYWNRYYARGTKEHYTVEPLGQKQLFVNKNSIVTAGQIYTTPNEVLHRVDVEDDILAATLVITHENAQWVTNDLFSEQLFGADLTYIPSLPFSTEELAEKIELIKSKINGGN